MTGIPFHDVPSIKGRVNKLCIDSKTNSVNWNPLIRDGNCTPVHSRTGRWRMLYRYTIFSSAIQVKFSMASEPRLRVHTVHGTCVINLFHSQRPVLIPNSKTQKRNSMGINCLETWCQRQFCMTTTTAQFVLTDLAHIR